MYGDLLDLLVADGVHLALAAIALPNPASVALHRAFGFEEVGVMREVGRKLDRWIDVLWMQKTLRPDRDPQVSSSVSSRRRTTSSPITPIATR